MHGWKYQSGGVVLLLARKDDFAGVPTHACAAVKGVSAIQWGDRPGNRLTDHLIGASRVEIEAALGTRGWFLYD
jgi:hypothetical protein